MRRRYLPLAEGLFIGIGFGFFLQRGGATYYNTIIGQLLLEDFTVLKIMLSAVITGMIGVHFLKDKGKVELVPKGGSISRSIFGGLTFGVGFALLGYCPGTIAGAAGQGSLDALIAGLGGIILGSGLFALSYDKLKPSLRKGEFTKLTLPELLGVNHWKVIIPLVIFLVGLLVLLEMGGY